MSELRQQGFEEQLKLELRQLAFQFHIPSSLHSQYFAMSVLWIRNQTYGLCSDTTQYYHFGSNDKKHASCLTLTVYLVLVFFIWWIFREWVSVSTFVRGRFLDECSLTVAFIYCEKLRVVIMHVLGSIDNKLVASFALPIALLICLISTSQSPLPCSDPNKFRYNLMELSEIFAKGSLDLYWEEQPSLQIIVWSGTNGNNCSSCSSTAFWKLPRKWKSYKFCYGDRRVSHQFWSWWRPMKSYYRVHRDLLWRKVRRFNLIDKLHCVFFFKIHDLKQRGE